MMQDTRREPSAEELTRIRAALDGFAASFRSSDQIMAFAVADLVNEMRDCVIERDCDNDTRLSLMVLESDIFAVIDLTPVRMRREDGDIAAFIKQLAMKVGSEHARLDRARDHLRHRILNGERQSVRRPLMPATPPEGLMEALASHADISGKKMVCVSDGDWPEVTDEVTAWLREFVCICAHHLGVPLILHLTDRKTDAYPVVWHVQGYAGKDSMRALISTYNEICRAYQRIPEAMERLGQIARL